MGDLRKMFGGGSTPEAVVMPTIVEPTVMPVVDDVAAAKARKKSLIAQQARGGRASTILSTDTKLG